MKKLLEHTFIKPIYEFIFRWDINALGQVPDYLKPLYSSLLNLFEELNDEMNKEERSYSITYTKDMVINYICRNYLSLLHVYSLFS